jgi:hypothetical protein
MKYTVSEPTQKYDSILTGRLTTLGYPARNPNASKMPNAPKMTIMTVSMRKMNMQILAAFFIAPILELIGFV